MTKTKKEVWKPKKVSAQARLMVTLGYTCPVCDFSNEVTLINPTIVGGCTGHREGEYCYCDSPHYEETTKCDECGVTVELQTGY